MWSFCDKDSGRSSSKDAKALRKTSERSEHHTPAGLRDEQRSVESALIRDRRVAVLCSRQLQAALKQKIKTQPLTS